MRPLLIVGAILLLAGCTETPTERACNTPSALEFGSIPLYARIDAPPPGAQVKAGCDPADECSFTTSEGIQYVVFQDELMEKRLFVPNTRGAARIPFTLEAGDTVAEVLAKLKAQGVFAERFDRDGEVFVLAGSCRGDPADELSVHFDAQGRIAQVELSMFPT